MQKIRASHRIFLHYEVMGTWEARRCTYPGCSCPYNERHRGCALQTLEAAFKIETVGLVTREEFLSKRETLKDRMDEAKAQAKREADKALNQACMCTPMPQQMAPHAVLILTIHSVWSSVSLMALNVRQRMSKMLLM